MILTSTRQRIEGIPYVPKEWETVACPFCGDTKYTRYERYGNTWQYTYVKCRNCGLIYQNPRPKYDSSFVHDAYEYYAEGIIKDIANPCEFVERESLREQNDDLIQEILLYDKQRTAILDVGCYIGTFLFQATKHYPIAYGVDVSSLMSDYVETHIGINVFRDKFEELQIEQKFSCINMSHVIEHIPNPKDWLAQSKKLLVDKGVLVISVPNMLSLTRRFKVFLKRIRLRKGRWEPFRTPDHLYEPTVPSMLRFLDENGFDVLCYKSYSRKKMVNHSIYAKWFHQKLHWGSNLRFYVTPRR